MTFSRRRLLVTGVALTAVAACGTKQSFTPPTLSDPAEPLPPIEDRIGLLEKRDNALVGIYGLNLESKHEVAHRQNDMFALCSTFKAYLAARILQKAQRSELAMTDTLYVDPAAVKPNSPVSGPKAGGRLPLDELCQAVLQRSDNTAANMLLSVIGGPPGITAFARSIADERTRLDHWETELNSALPGDPRDTSTPRAFGGGIRAILTEDVLDEAHRKQLEDWMRGNVTSRMRAGLPPGWTSADKTGTGDFASTNDIGIVYGPNGERILLAIMTRTRSDNPDAPALGQLIADVTTLALPTLRGQG
ncbi:MAG: class A beta-lactamase [Mycobacterium sp.]